MQPCLRRFDVAFALAPDVPLWPSLCMGIGTICLPIQKNDSNEKQFAKMSEKDKTPHGNSNSRMQPPNLPLIPFSDPSFHENSPLRGHTIDSGIRPGGVRHHCHTDIHEGKFCIYHRSNGRAECRGTVTYPLGGNRGKTLPRMRRPSSILPQGRKRRPGVPEQRVCLVPVGGRHGVRRVRCHATRAGLGNVRVAKILDYSRHHV